MAWEIVPPVSNLASFERERWRPRMRAGHLRTGDRRFYLYGDKHTVTLAQIQVTRFTLGNWPEPYPDTEPTVKVSGVDYTFWVIDGRDLLVAHIDLDQPASYWGGALYDEAEWERLRLAGVDFSPTSTVDVTYSSFVDVDTPLASHSESFQFKEGETEWWMSEIPVISSPVVITDDVPVAWQGNQKTTEFTYSSDTTLVDREGENVLGSLELNTQFFFNVPDNTILNPAFANSTEVLGRNNPDHWQLTGPEVILGPSTYPYHGRNVVYSLGGDYAQQLIPVTGTQFAVSAFARAFEGTGEALLGVNFTEPSGLFFINPSGVTGALLSDDSYLEVFTTQEVIEDEWSQLVLRLGETDLIYTGVDSPLPSGEIEMLVKLGGTGILWDAVQVVQGFDVQDFGYIDPDKITIEYEVNEEGLFVTNSEKEYPYDISDTDLNPIIDVSNQGFLTWIDSPYADDYKLGYGRDTDGEGKYDWAIYTGEIDSAVTGFLQEYNNNGAEYILIATGESLALTGAAASVLGYISIDATGLSTENETEDFISSLTGAATEAISDSPILGLVYDVGSNSLRSNVNDPELWVSALTGVHTYLSAAHTGQSIFGIYGGLNLFSETVSNRNELGNILDLLVVDGLTKDDTLRTSSLVDRQHTIALVNQAQEVSLANTGNMDVLVIDYAQDEYDYDIIAEARKTAHNEGWLHATVIPAGGIPDIEDRFYTPYGYSSTVPTNTTGTYFGRQHTPYARVDGPGKYIHRPQFRDTLPRRYEMPTHTVPETRVDKIILIPTTTAYSDGGTNKITVSKRPFEHTGVEYPYVTMLAALAVDERDNPVEGVPLHFTLDPSEILADTGFVDRDNNVEGLVVQQYTDHGGYAYVRFRINQRNPIFIGPPTTTATIIVESRRSNVSASLEVEA